MAITVATDLSRFDLARVTAFIQQSYWGQGRSARDIQTSLENSSVVGLFEGDKQIGMARAMSDGIFAAYVFDLFIFEEFRGRGLAHPDLIHVPIWMLSTRDAHGLYARYGFEVLPEGRVMRMVRG